MVTVCRVVAQLEMKLGTILCLCVIAIDCVMGASLEVVALSGQQAPGLKAGVFFGDLWGNGNVPHFNAVGQVLLPVKLTGAGVNEDNDGGLWIMDTATATASLIARQGDQAPGAPTGVTIGTRAFVNRPHYPEHFGQSVDAFNDLGQFVYWTDLSGPGVDATNDSGLLTGTSLADLELLVRAGDQAAGMPTGVVYTNLVRDNPVINSSGQVVISGRVGGPGIAPSVNGDALWTGQTGDLALVVQQADAAPDTTEKFALHMYKGFEALIDDLGNLQVKSSLSSNGLWTVSSETGLWTGSNGANLQLLARENDAATDPSLAPGIVMTNNYFLRPTTSTGKFIFEAKLSGPGVTNFVDSGSLWTGTTAGDLSLVARQNDPSLPGSGGNLTFEVFSSPVMNESGAFIFRTAWDHITTNSPAVVGIHMGTSADDLVLLAGGDQSVPGLNPDWRIYNQGGMAINDAGQVVFSAYIKESALSNTSMGQGIWGYDPASGVSLLVKRGDQLEVAPGEMRTVSTLFFDGGSSLADGTPRGLLENGQFMFRAIFTDGSQGVFVGSFVAIPEPSIFSLTNLRLLAILILGRSKDFDALK